MTTILKGDCIEVMKGMPAKSVDCFICDLPYGQLTGGAGKEKAKRAAAGNNGHVGGCDWDIKIDLAAFWVQVKRLCKTDNTPVLMFCNTKFGYELIKSNEDWFRYDIVWAKTNAVGFLRANKMPMAAHEMIYVFSKKAAFYQRINTNERCPTSVVTVTNKKEKGGHPTAKPKELYEWLLRRYVPDNGTVLDPTAGSFNSVFVAKTLGYKAIGIEMDNVFFWKAVSKLSGPI